MKRKSFVFYASFYEAIEALPKEYQGEVYSAVCGYVFTGKEPSEITPVAKALFLSFKPQIDANNKKFENGCKGGARNDTEAEPNGNQDGTKEEPNENQTDTKPEPRRNQEGTTPTPNEKGVMRNNNENILFPYREIVAAWNEILKNEPKVTKIQGLSEKRKKSIKARYEEYKKSTMIFLDPVPFFTNIFRKIQQSDFLSGRTPRNDEHQHWKIDIDWVMQPTNFLKIREGKYSNTGSAAPATPTDAASGFKIVKH